MIVTLTPNPSLDHTIEISTLIRGSILPAVRSWYDPAGKGINVSRALAGNGFATQAVFPSGGAEGAHLRALLNGTGVDVSVVEIAGAIRSNVDLIEPDGTVTALREAGPSLSSAELSSLESLLIEKSKRARWTVLSGSLPPDVPVDFYAMLTERVRATGARVAVDASDGALAAAIEAGPDLIKPNQFELAAASGIAVETFGDAVAAGHELQRRGARAIIASLGSTGALYFGEGTVLFAPAPPIQAKSAVGAGDSMLAGFLAIDDAPEVAFARAATWGTAAASLPGSLLPTTADLEGMVIELAEVPAANVPIP